jgi:regulator of nonsense transcripts 3
MAAKGRSGGVLPINAAVTKKEKSAQGQAKSSPRTQGPRLRLIVRRLPPGLTEAEFWTALGEEWQVGRSKVDWAAFKEGKVSKECVLDC